MAANVAVTDDEMSQKKRDLTEYLKRGDGPKLMADTTTYQTATTDTFETSYETVKGNQRIMDTKQDVNTIYIEDSKDD
jgi:hypothetical protein